MDGPAGEVELLVADVDVRWLEAAPSAVTIGAIKLRGWQVRPVVPMPDAYRDHDGYLVRINYEMVIEPDAPAPLWFEVGFELSLDNGAVTIVDAIPYRVTEPQAATAYTLNDDLNLVPVTTPGNADVAMPPVLPIVDVFGPGGTGVRWRHLSANTIGVRPGLYSGWVVVAVPPGCEQVSVEVGARFDLVPEAPDVAGGGYRPATRSSRFVLPLRPQASPQSAVAPRRHRGAGGVRTNPPRVFISYAHDSHRHKERVRAFAELLAHCGLDVHLDRWDLDLRLDWSLWAIEQISQADFVTVIASPLCRAVGNGEVENQDSRGMQSELSALRELLHSDRARWRTRILPVVLADGTAEDIPLFLQPHTADHYVVRELSVAGAEDLLRVMTGQPPYQRPQPALDVVDLPPRPPAS